MPLLVLDEPRHAPASLGRNAAVHTELSRRFALEHLGYPVWGLSPSSTPSGDSYREYGARVLGARGYRAGAVTPHAAALALLTEPAAAMSQSAPTGGTLSAVRRFRLLRRSGPENRPGGLQLSGAESEHDSDCGGEPSAEWDHSAALRRRSHHPAGVAPAGGRAVFRLMLRRITDPRRRNPELEPAGVVDHAALTRKSTWIAS